jgi:hypothetical protein
MTDRIVYSTGDINYTIYARLIAQSNFPKPSFDFHPLVWRWWEQAEIEPIPSRDILQVRLSEERRFGKARAGHYTRIRK